MADPDPVEARASGAGSLAAAADAETHLPRAADARWSDYTRATVGRMAAALVGEVCDALAARLGMTCEAEKVLHRLGQAGTSPAGLPLAPLARRAAEHRLAARRDDPSPQTLHPLLSHADPLVAQAARALLAAEPARLDRFHDPLLPAADLPAGARPRLVWAVAAALRPRAADDAEDTRIAAAAADTIAAMRDAVPHEARATALVRALDAVALLDDAALRTFAEGGHVAALVAALALRTRIAAAGAWEIVLGDDAPRLALLLRAAEVTPAATLAILRAVVPSCDAAALAVGTGAMPVAHAHDALRLWRLDPAYRAALAERAAS